MDILPFRDYFASIFFISIGMLLQVRYFSDHWVMLIGLTTALALVKTAVVTGVALFLGYPLRSSLLAGLALAQVGEFSFLLAQQGELFGLIGGEVCQDFVNTSILTLLATPFIMQIAPWFADRIRLPQPESASTSNVCSLNGHTIIAGYGQAEIPKRVRAALDKVGLLSKERAYPITLSGGEQQRVGIARAVVNRPALLLADEPTGNLDPEMSWEVMRIFREFDEVGVTVLIASHNIDLIPGAGPVEAVLDVFERPLSPRKYQRALHRSLLRPNLRELKGFHRGVAKWNRPG